MIFFLLKKKIRRRIAFFSVSLILINHPSPAQTTAADFTKVIQILPPSPAAAGLGQYGGVNSSLSTGSPNVSIPLLDYQVKTLSLPVSISYSSNGIKVDQISGRTGMGWVLDESIITRTVYDVPDEDGQALTVPQDLFTPSSGLYDFFRNASNTAAGFDTQPDIYSFKVGGYSGKFIIAEGKVKQLVHNNIQFEKNPDGYDFKVTLPDGSVWYFGGADATETTRAESSCDKHTPSYVPTAWYLKKIILYSGETIDFTYLKNMCSYSLGVNETIMKKVSSSTEYCQGADLFPDYAPQFCVSRFSSSSCRISEITSSKGNALKFNYINRMDIPDEYLLSSVQLFEAGAGTSPEKTVRFSYTYSNSSSLYPNSFNQDVTLSKRAFLSSIEEISSGNVTVKKYAFLYDDINGLPPRLSFCQDLTGCFNGSSNFAHIVPQTDPSQNDQYYYADRSFDFPSARKGLLTRISYPTGGSDSILYEPNKIYDEVVTTPALLTEVAEGFGSGIRSAQIHTSATINPVINQSASLVISAEYTGDPSAYLEAYHFVKAEVLDQSTNSVVFIQSRTNAGQSVVFNIPLTGTHQYILRLTVYGAAVLGGLELRYYNEGVVRSMQNVVKEGIRVAKILTFDPVSKNTLVKKYIYNTLTSGLAISSGISFFSPEYSSTVTQARICNENGPLGQLKHGTYTMLYSNAVNTIYMQDFPVVYSDVTESFGEDFENGGINHTFLIAGDTPGETLWGNAIGSAPLSNYGTMNGLELTTSWLSKTNGNLSVIKKVDRSYKIDPRAGFETFGYVVRSNFESSFHTPVQFEDFERFDAQRYSIMGQWFYQDTVKTSLTGQSVSLKDTVAYEYLNPSHALPYKITNSASDGKSKIHYYIYPDDAGLISGPEPGQLSLISRLKDLNIQQPVEEISEANGMRIERIRNVYNDFNGKVLLYKRQAEYGTSGLYDKVLLHNYDQDANLLSFSLDSGPVCSYQWGYNRQYPVAECKNAAESEFYYQSFEEEEQASSGVAHTGQKYYSGAYYVNWALPNGREYVISYWYRQGGIWKYSGQQTYNGPVTLSQGDAFDDIRIHPKDAPMTTYTYKPLVGMSSSTDEKSNTTFYEYDDFQRLKWAKDRSGAILKDYTYHYKP